jgi:type IV pilus assembly protein PilA
MKNKTQGFTLIELLIVIAIIGILAVVLIPNLLAAQKRAYDTGAASCAKSIQTAMATLQIDKNSYASITSTGATAGSGLLSLEGINNSCKDTTNMTIAIVTAPNQNDYSFSVKDGRGQKLYTVTPSSLTSL